MFGMGWAELMIVGIVALIVVGPQELPMLFRKIGQFAGGLATTDHMHQKSAAREIVAQRFLQTITAPHGLGHRFHLGA